MSGIVLIHVVASVINENLFNWNDKDKATESV